MQCYHAAIFAKPDPGQGFFEVFIGTFNMQKKIKNPLTLAHESFDESAKKNEDSAAHHTVEGRDEKAEALEASLKYLKKSLSPYGGFKLILEVSEQTYVVSVWFCDRLWKMHSGI